MGFLAETGLYLIGAVVGGNLIKVGLKWLKYGIRKITPPDDKK